MQQNRRQNERVNLSVEIILESLSGRRECRITDLSRGGCYVDSIASMNEGETVVFKLQTPTGRWLRLSGKAAYIFPGSGFGIRFDNLAEEDRNLLELVIIAHGGQPAQQSDSDVSGEKKSEEFDEFDQFIQDVLEQAEKEK